MLTASLSMGICRVAERITVTGPVSSVFVGRLACCATAVLPSAPSKKMTIGILRMIVGPRLSPCGRVRGRDSKAIRWAAQPGLDARLTPSKEREECVDSAGSCTYSSSSKTTRQRSACAQGAEGLAEVLTGGGWRAVTLNGVMSGPGSMDYEHDMGPYVQEMVDWLDDEKKVHPCNGESAYKDLEIMMAICRSVVQRGKVKLPLGPGEPELEALKRVLPD